LNSEYALPKMRRSHLDTAKPCHVPRHTPGHDIIFHVHVGGRSKVVLICKLELRIKPKEKMKFMIGISVVYVCRGRTVSQLVDCRSIPYMVPVKACHSQL
jgi:hypothetical protein